MSDGVSLCRLQLPQVCWKPQGTNRGRGLIVGLTYSINVMRAWGCVSVGGCVKCGGGGRVWVWGEGGGIFLWVYVGGTYFCSCWLGRDWKPLILKVSSTSVYYILLIHFDDQKCLFICFTFWGHLLLSGARFPPTSPDFSPQGVCA